MVGYTSMALNALKCNHLTSLGLKGLKENEGLRCTGAVACMYNFRVQ